MSPFVNFIRVFPVVFSLISLPATALLAKEAVPMAEDPVVEKRVQELGSELRCLVCQNQTIADSHADLAKDLKRELREQIKAGKTDDEIKAFMVARYGDFVLYRPPFKFKTLLLWLGPLLLLVIAAIAFALNIRSRQKNINDTPFSESERAKINALLENKE